MQPTCTAVIKSPRPLFLISTGRFFFLCVIHVLGIGYFCTVYNNIFLLYTVFELGSSGFSFHTFWFIGHLKAMSLSNNAQQKAVCRQKVELTPDFSRVDPPQSAEVRQRWDWSWSQSGPPPS